MSVNESSVRRRLGLDSCSRCPSKSSCENRQRFDKLWNDAAEMDRQLRVMDERLDRLLAFERDGQSGLERLVRKDLGLPPRVSREEKQGEAYETGEETVEGQVRCRMRLPRRQV